MPHHRVEWALVVITLLAASAALGVVGGQALGEVEYPPGFRSWPELSSWVRQHWTGAEADELGAQIVFEYEGGRAQAVYLSRHESLDREWLDVAAAVAPEAEVATTSILAESYTLAVGALSLDDEEGVLVLRATLPLDRCDPESLALLVETIASSADQLEERYTHADTY